MPAENDELDVSHQTGVSDSQPGNISQPEITHPADAGRSTSQPGENLAQTLSEINVNMGTMASLLKTIVERQNTEPQKKRRHSQHESVSADSESEDIECETASKRRREDDELSLSPSDGDIADLLEGSNSKEVEAPSKTTEPEEELELLKSLEADFTDDENVGAKINQSLANIASKRWGITLPNDKLKALLAKHAKPENCADISTVRVNPEIWDQMNNFKRKADLRVGNIQQTLQKATFGILKASDRLVDQQPNTDKETLAANIDAIVLIGHAVGELSRLRREQIKPALKAEFHSLCTQTNESASRSDLLFGADLAKQVRDAKDTNKIGKAIGAGKSGATRFSRPYNSHYDNKHRAQKNYGKHSRPGESKPYFLGKGQKKPTFSKNRTERT